MPQWFLRFSEFSEFNEFNESSAPFRENSNVMSIVQAFSMINTLVMLSPRDHLKVLDGSQRVSPKYHMT